jgi:putative ABC transport system substrate-binding protein
MRLSAIGLVVILTCGVLVAPLAVAAQQPGKVPRLGVLVSGFSPSDAAEILRSPYWQEMHARGWVMGQTIMVELRQAEGHYDRLPALAAELVQLKVDVLLTQEFPAARAAQHATRTIPIVALVGEVLTTGLVASLAQPGGNLTGVTWINQEHTEKRLELLKEALPGATRVAALWNPTNPAIALRVPVAQRAAAAMGLSLEPVVEAREVTELEEAFATLARARPDALLILDQYWWPPRRTPLLDLIANSRLPVIYEHRGWVAAGGLMSYGPKSADLYHRAAVLTDKILHGAKPADMPVEQAMTFELVINLKTAQALGLTIPPTLLFQADEVIR